MNATKISDIEAFKRESDKARNIPLLKEEIKRINDLSREVEKEEPKNSEDDLPNLINTLLNLKQMELEYSRHKLASF